MGEKWKNDLVRVTFRLLLPCDFRYGSLAALILFCPQ